MHGATLECRVSTKHRAATECTGSFQCMERLWIAGTGSGVPRPPVHGVAVKCTELPSAWTDSGMHGSPGTHRVALRCRDSPKHEAATGCANSPGARTDCGMHGAILGCRDTPKHRAATAPGAGTGFGVLGARNAQRARGVHRISGAWMDPGVHRTTLGCRDPTKHRPATKHRSAQSLSVHEQTQGCVRQLQVQVQAVECRDSPVYGMAMECTELPRT